jgi:pimeloyl-ACP methyl ester carboxylesterase
MMNRRTFSAALVAGAAASLISTKRTTAAGTAPVKARNVVLVHGLFADGSCWSEVIARLQAAGLNATAVQNPLTTLPEAVASAERVLARQDGPTVLVGHSFSGIIVTEAGCIRTSRRLSMLPRGRGRGRGLHRLGQDLSDTAGHGRHHL